jgi:hypothetical protein
MRSQGLPLDVTHIFVQDDMMADLSSHLAFEGAGPIGDGPGRG